MQRTSTPTRNILIVSASMGGGHDGAANELRRRLTSAGHTVEIVDFLDLVELKIGRLLAVVYQLQLRLMPWTYQLTYFLSALLRRPTTALDMWLTRRKLSRCVRKLQPDVVVSVYPLSSLVLGRMRRKRVLRVPVVTYLTDFSVHPMWVDAGVDCHLAVSGASAELAARRGARDTLVRGPLVGPAFGARAADRQAMRDQLGLSDDERAVLVVAGAWGAGDIGTTVDEIAAGGELHPIVVCGRNERLRAELVARGTGTIIGWTDQMPSLMAAVDAVVENAGGLTCMEAFAAGVPVVTYLPIPGHGRDNAATMESSGVNLFAHDADQLRSALRRATEPGATRDELVASAAALFVGDPAAEVERVAAAAKPVGRWRVVPIGVRPSLRAAAVLVLCLGAYSTVSLMGTEMSAYGIGVAKAPVATRHSTAYLGVRLGGQDLTDPALLKAIADSGASVVVDAATLRAQPGVLAGLAAAHVDVVNGGAGRHVRLGNRQAHADLVSAGRLISTELGRPVNAFTPSGQLDGFDYYYARQAHVRLVHPDHRFTPAKLPAHLTAGKIYVLLGRRESPDAIMDALASLEGSAQRDGLGIASLGSLR